MQTQVEKSLAAHDAQVVDIISNMAERPTVHRHNLISIMFIILMTSDPEELQGYDWETFRLMYDLIERISETPQGMGMIK